MWDSSMTIMLLEVADFARKAGIEFMNGAGIVTWFGMVLVK